MYNALNSSKSPKNRTKTPRPDSEICNLTDAGENIGLEAVEQAGDQSELVTEEQSESETEQDTEEQS